MPISLTGVIKITRIRSPPPLTGRDEYLWLKAADSESRAYHTTRIPRACQSLQLRAKSLLPCKHLLLGIL